MSHKYISAEQTVSDFMPEVDLTSDPDAEAIIDSIIERVSMFIDRHCKRPDAYFMPAGDTATQRRFRGRGDNFLQLPVYVAGTLAIAGMATGSFYENASNGWAYFNDVNDATGDYHFDEGQRYFEKDRLFLVTAKWGYEETPGPIVHAAGEITAAIWSKGKGVVGEVSPEGFVIERAIPLTAREMLSSYVRREFEIQ